MNISKLLQNVARATCLVCAVGLVGCGGGGDGGNVGSGAPAAVEPAALPAVVPAKLWGEAQTIESNIASALFPKVAINASGNAVAVWVQPDGAGPQSIWANSYSKVNGWGTATLIETDETGSAASPQVTIDNAGNALVVWTQFDGTNFNITSNRYTVGSGWGTARLIETEALGNAASPKLAMLPNGDAFAVWQQRDATFFNIWTNRYTAGVGWGAAVKIETGSGDASNPAIAVSADGSAIAVWQQFDAAPRANIVANRYDPILGWRSEVLIEADNMGNAANPQVAMDASGRALVVWAQYDGTRNTVRANRYSASAWGLASVIQTGNDEGSDPQIAMNADGNAVAVWEQAGLPQSNIWANRYTAGSGWGTAVLTESDAGKAVAPKVAIDAFGNAMAVWAQTDGTRYNTIANRYTAASGWGTAARIETDDTWDVSRPEIAMNTPGEAVAVWGQSNRVTESLNANTFR